MKKLLLIFTLSLFTFSSGAQELISGQLSGGSASGGLISTTPVVENSQIEGSPYVNEEFLPAKISASEDNIFYVRYNALKDEFEVKGANNVAYALNKYRRDIVVELISNNKTYQVYGYLDKNENENFGYFVNLSNPNSNIKLLKKENITFVKEKVAVTSYDSSQPARYKRGSDAYYVKINDNNAVLLSTNKKDVSKLFPGNEKKVLDFIKKEKLKLKKEDDMNKLIQFTNTLI
ncbi:hypothetical protein GCM10011531_22260 [Aquaticitalea lipolytica]|uniref:Uncharacterized protein n=1 Tax=Aquaticitalea lipolytica TaxID=1247562 RepID=A0A8J2XGS9_9FLAO|nr:hypothetical protein [Aquaticitalea lipolytica]GFZ90225.1 hypothetical protein GCM10011531_22260 [Aquaticitalea lipolytica]